MSILVCGDRRSGKTTKLCELLEARHRVNGGKALLVLPRPDMCSAVDEMLVKYGWFGVLTKGLAQVDSRYFRGREWCAIGLDEPPPGWTQEYAGIDIYAHTVLTQGPLRVIEPEWVSGRN